MSNVTFDIIARDRASATFRKVGVETESLHSKLRTLVAGAGLATLGYAAVQFGKDAVKAFADAQTAQLKLQDAFKRFPALSDVTISSLRDLNMVLEAKTGADHNALASGEAVLAGFKLTGDQIAKIIPLVDDYAAKTGADIPTAAAGVGKALLGNTRYLKQIGIEFKATGNEAQDFATITGLLQQKLGGFATREGKTAAGQLKILQAQFRDVEAELGSALLPALLDLGHFLLRDVIPPVKATAHFLEENKNVLEPLAKAIGVAWLAWKSYTIWTRAAAAANALFVGSAAATGAGAVTAGAAAAARGAGGFGILALGRAATLAPAAGVGAQSDVRVPATDKTAQQLFTEMNALAATLRGAQEVAAKKFYHDVVVPSGFSAATEREFIDRFGKAATAEKKLGDAAKQTTQSLGAQVTAFNNAQAKAIDLSTSQDALRTAIHNMAIVAGGQSARALKGNSDAAIANRDALRGAVSQAQSYLAVLKQHGASAGHIAQVEFGLASAIKRTADNTYGNSQAVRDLLKQLGFLPGQIAAVVAELGVAQQAWNATFGSDRRGLGDFTFFRPGEMKGAGKKAGQAWTSGWTPPVDKATTAAATKAQQAFQAAAQKMRTDLQQILGDFRSERDSLLSSFSTLQTSGTDILGATGPGQGIVAQLRQGAEKMHTFARLWHRLDELGLDPRLLAQFAGPDYIPAMRELLRSGRSGIRRADRFERQIASDAAGIARADTLTKDGQLIHHDLETLPPKLRREFLNALQHAKFTVDFDNGKHDRHNGRKVRHHG